MLTEKQKRIISNTEKTGSRPYSETKKILDEAAKRTVEELSQPPKMKSSALGIPRTE